MNIYGLTMSKSTCVLKSNVNISGFYLYFMFYPSIVQRIVSTLSEDYLHNSPYGVVGPLHRMSLSGKSVSTYRRL